VSIWLFFGGKIKVESNVYLLFKSIIVRHIFIQLSDLSVLTSFVVVVLN